MTGESEPAVFFRFPGPVAGLHLFIALEGPAEALKLRKVQGKPHFSGGPLKGQEPDPRMPG